MNLLSGTQVSLKTIYYLHTRLMEMDGSLDITKQVKMLWHKQTHISLQTFISKWTINKKKNIQYAII